MGLCMSKDLFKSVVAGREFEIRPAHEVSRLDLSGSVNVHYIQAKKPFVMVVADSKEYLKEIVTMEAGGVLSIHQKNKTIIAAGGNVIVTGNGNMVSLGDMYIADGKFVDGSANRAVTVDVCVAMPSVEAVSVSGSSDIKIKSIAVSKLDLSVSGVGNIKASGVADDLTVSVSGSGSAKLKSLKSRHASLHVSGAGNIKARVSETIKVNLSGVSDINIKGSPKVLAQRVSGLGCVQFSD